MLATTLSLRTAGLATLLSHKCDIRALLKDDHIARDNCLPVHFRDAETTILIKFAFWSGSGRGKIYGQLSKNAVFPGISMTIRFGDFTNFIVRNLVVIWEAPNIVGVAVVATLGQTSCQIKELPTLLMTINALLVLLDRSNCLPAGKCRQMSPIQSDIGIQKCLACSTGIELGTNS